MTASKHRRWTFVGLAIALLGIPLIVTLQRLAVPAPTEAVLVAREVAILGATGLLLWIVTTKEKLGLDSIGLRFNRVGLSIALGLGLAIVCFGALLACLYVFSLLGVRYGEGATIAKSLPVTLLAVIRAGISEETFYRGFAIERLQSLTGSKWVAASIALAAFAGFHFRQGVPGILLAAILGAIITGFYLWRRDLLAAIFAHFLVDFVPNVLLA